jgi:hypothetical protein
MAFASFATSNQINAVKVENRKFHHQTTVNWMNYTIADIFFNFLKYIADNKKDEIMTDLKESAKKVYIPSVSIFSVYECVFAKIPGSRDDCRHDSVRAWSLEPMSVLDYVSDGPGWHNTPDKIIPEKFYKFGHIAPDGQNDFYQTLRDSDTLRLLENYLGDNFSCHVDRKEIRKTLQFTAYKVEVCIQFHLTKRPEYRKEQIASAVGRYEIRQKSIAEDKKWDRWNELNEEDNRLAARLEAIPYPFVGLSAFEASSITARRKAIYAEMYPEDGPEYDQDDLNKAAVENRRGF